MVNDSVPIAQLQPGDLFTFGPPVNAVYRFCWMQIDRFRFEVPTFDGHTYSCPIQGAKVWRV